MLAFFTRSPVCRTAGVEVLCVSVLQYEGLVDAQKRPLNILYITGARNDYLAAAEEEEHHFGV